MLTGPDLQLNRLRIASDSMMTEYNPNYEFGGVVYTLKDLKDIPREQLRLVKWVLLKIKNKKKCTDCYLQLDLELFILKT